MTKSKKRSSALVPLVDAMLEDAFEEARTLEGMEKLKALILEKIDGLMAVRSNFEDERALNRWEKEINQEKKEEI